MLYFRISLSINNLYSTLTDKFSYKFYFYNFLKFVGRIAFYLFDI